MKKKNLIKKLQLKKSQVSNFNKEQIVGGSWILCGPYDISELETCYEGCGLTDTCTQFNTCNDVSFLNCTVYNCPSDGCGTGTGGNGGSGGFSCPGYEC